MTDQSVTLDPTKLAAIRETTRLVVGHHDITSGEGCAMDVIAWASTGEISDMPSCVHPILARHVHRLNDRLGSDEVLRWRIVDECGPLLVGTADWDPVRACIALTAAGTTVSGYVEALTIARTAVLSGAVLSDAVLRGAVLSGADLSGAVLSGAVLSDAVLSDAVLRGADLRGAVLRGADLRGAVLRGAVLSGADLSGADLRDADLRDADLRDAVLRGADLRGADLRDAVLRGADLRDADLRDADLRGAWATTTTVWSADFDAKAAGIRMAVTDDA